jgi:hypothetical protein
MLVLAACAPGQALEDSAEGSRLAVGSLSARFPSGTEPAPDSITYWYSDLCRDRPPHDPCPGVFLRRRTAADHGSCAGPLTTTRRQLPTGQPVTELTCPANGPGIAYWRIWHVDIDGGAYAAGGLDVPSIAPSGLVDQFLGSVRAP